MRFVTVRDLRNKPAEIRESLFKEKEMVLTSNGKPFAILVLTSEEELEKSLAMLRRVRTEKAVAAMQKRSIEKGGDKLTPEEIDAEISHVRKRRKQ